MVIMSKKLSRRGSGLSSAFLFYKDLPRSRGLYGIELAYAPTKRRPSRNDWWSRELREARPLDARRSIVNMINLLIRCRPYLRHFTPLYRRQAAIFTRWGAGQAVFAC